MKFTNQILLATSALLATLGAGTANAAGFDGATIRGTYEFPNAGTVAIGPSNAVVGSGVEFNDINGLRIDFSSNSLVVTDLTGFGFGSTSFNGLHFFDVNSTVPAITGLTQTAATVGFAPIATFDANNIFLNFTGLDSGAINRSVTYSVAFAPVAGAVPEPATWAMMLVGFGGVGFAMRRRKSKVTTNVAFA